MSRNFSPYQLVHLTKLRTNGLNSLLVCDGVGVGKTISAGYAIYHMSQVERLPVLIVCPPILVDKWRFELLERFGLKSVMTTKIEEFELMSEEMKFLSGEHTAPIYITSYSLLSREEGLPELSIGLVVFDEVHAIRNSKTKAHSNAKLIAENAEYRLGLSATPINNSISDLASILSVMLPQLDYDGVDEFLQDYWDNPLMDSVSSIITRFDKEQISNHFTHRNIHTVPLEYPEDYMAWVNECVDGLPGSESTIAFRNIAYYRMAASSPRAFCKSMSLEIPNGFEDTKLESLKGLIDSKPGERWLVFTEFKETASLLKSSIGGRSVLVLSGDSLIEERDASKRLFAREEDSVLIMTPVGSEGLDFQICSNLVNYDLHWNPMKIEQRIGRIDRIGQEKPSIDVYNFLLRGSIDERVMETINRKMDLISGSFAEIMPILEPPWEGSYMADLESSRIETEKAIELENATRFFHSLTAPDLEVIQGLEPDLCNTDNWSILDWTSGAPWISKCESWAESNYSQGQVFLSSLTAYC